MTRNDLYWPRGDGEMAGRIRELDWAGTPLGPIAGWPDALRIAADLMLAMPGPATILWGAAHVQLYNDAYIAIARDRHPALLGRPVAEGWPDAYEAVIKPLLAETGAGRAARLTDYAVLLSTPDGGQEERVFDTAWSPVRDAGGAVAGALQTLVEVTDDRRAQAALRASEQRFRSLVTAGSYSVYRMSPDWRQMYALDGRGFLANTGGPTEGWADTYILPEDRPAIFAAIAAAIRDKGMFELEHRVRRADGGVGWTLSRAVPILDEAGGIVEWFGAASDVTARKEAELALRESEARFQHVVRATRDIVWDIDLVADRVWWSEALRTELGFSADEIGPDTAWCFSHMHPEDRARVVAGMREAAAGTGHDWSDEFRYRRADGRYAHIADRGFIVRDAAGRAVRMTGAMQDVTLAKRAEAALRENEERQVFLLTLTDALRPLADPPAIQGTACRLLGEQLRVERAYYVEIDEPGGVATVRQDYVLAEAASLAGEHPVARFSWAVEILRRGECHVVTDTQDSPVVPRADRDALAALRIIACIGAPLIKAGALVGALCVTASRPRIWTDAEVALLREVGDRIWAAIERARAEADLRASEERFAQFAASSSDALWIRDAATLAMEYVSPAIEAIYGASPEALLGDVRRWATLIVPEDRDVALRHLEEARTGRNVVHEFRIRRPGDGAFRWVRDTDFPLRDAHGRVQRIGGIAEDVTEARLSAEHQEVLVAELQHRVRNIMAQLRAITAQTAETAADVPDYAALMAGRLQTFARVQTLLTRGANLGVDLATILRGELDAQARGAAQYALAGPDVVLAPKAAEVLTLAVHELVTNALKYGALSVPDGRIAVAWDRSEQGGTPWLRLDWTESGVPQRLDPASPRRRGFGTELIEGRIPYELGGRGQVVVEPGGAHCHLEFPLSDGASILATNAPRRARVFGGALDMKGQADLSGQRILVIEDDYYLARDTAGALRGAGAAVIGPYATETDACAALSEARPTAAVVDINLGAGASFDLARVLRERDIPFVFVTGYDVEVIPEAYDAVPRLQKPVELKQIVGALAGLFAIAG